MTPGGPDGPTLPTPADDAAWLRSTLDALPSFVGYVDRAQRNRFANAAASTWLGVPPERLHGRHLRDLLGERRYREALPHIEGVLGGEPQTFERMIPLATGGVVPARTHYLPTSADGEVDGFHTYIVALTPAPAQADEPPLGPEHLVAAQDQVLQRLFAAGLNIRRHLADTDVQAAPLQAALDEVQLSITHLRDQIRAVQRRAAALEAEDRPD